MGRDPEIRYIEGKPMASFSLATTERAYKTASGATIPERTEWHNIIMWGSQAEQAEKYIRSGTRLYIEGKIRSRVWEDRNTIKRTVTEIYCESFEILSRKNS